MKVKIVNKSSNKLPFYAKEGDAGMDLRADLYGEIKAANKPPIFGKSIEEGVRILRIPPQARLIVSTNIFIELPEGFEAQIRPRSGMSFKTGLDIALGTIDSNYRGEVGVICGNFTNEPITIKHGDRIAQMVVNKVEKVEWKGVDKLSDSERGENGFGSTGKE